MHFTDIYEVASGRAAILRLKSHFSFPLIKMTLTKFLLNRHFQCLWPAFQTCPFLPPIKKTVSVSPSSNCSANLANQYQQLTGIGQCLLTPCLPSIPSLWGVCVCGKQLGGLVSGRSSGLVRPCTAVYLRSFVQSCNLFPFSFCFLPLIPQTTDFQSGEMSMLSPLS